MPCCLFYCPIASQLGPKPFKRVVAGCLENSDLENSDPRPEKLRASGVSKTLTPKKLRASGVSKTQTRKTQTLGCLENSDPEKTQTLGCLENSDPKNKTYLHCMNSASRLVYCSLIQWHYHNLPRKKNSS